MQIKYAKSAAKTINFLDKDVKKRIKNGIEGITENPAVGDIKQMQGYHPTTYRLRIGKYRIIFEYVLCDDKNLVNIKDIGLRGDIYK